MSELYYAVTAEIEPCPHLCSCETPSKGDPDCEAWMRDMSNIVQDVLDLHKADEDGNCTACGVDTSEAPISWPCDTIKIIADTLGIGINKEDTDA